MATPPDLQPLVWLLVTKIVATAAPAVSFRLLATNTGPSLAWHYHERSELLIILLMPSSQLCYKQLRTRGPHSTVDRILASRPAAPGLVLGIPNFFQRKIRCCQDLLTAHCLERVDNAKLKSRSNPGQFLPSTNQSGSMKLGHLSNKCSSVLLDRLEILKLGQTRSIDFSWN